MKKVLGLFLSTVLLLLFFSACNEPNDASFIGTVKSVSGEDITVTVAEKFTKANGETVKIQSENAAQLAVGDELRVQIVDGAVKECTVLLAVENMRSDGADPDSPPMLQKWEDTKVPKGFPDFNDRSLEIEVRESDCFGTHNAYRVVDQNKSVTYLSNVGSRSSEFVIMGDVTDKCKLGDFVVLTTSKHSVNACYRAADAKDITKLEVIDSKKALQYVEMNNRLNSTFYKPVIYLYPQQTVSVDVALELDGRLTCTYPEYADGWDGLTVYPNGTIQKDGREYYCLYWEGESRFEPDFSKGFCVKSEDTASFLEKTLREMGLNDREANEFIIYWLPILQQNEYNLISFQGENYTELAKLTVSPTPDSVLRVFMSFKALENPTEVEPQVFTPFERNGFAVVEWGGGPA